MVNEIKLYFNIDIPPISLQRILIKFGYRSKMKPKSASNSCNQEEKLGKGTSSSKLVHWRLEKVLLTDESKIICIMEMDENIIEGNVLKILRWWFKQM